MEKFKGTKGKWIIDTSIPNDPNGTIINIESKENYPYDWFNIVLLNAKDTKTQIANAHLICAAPELLEALQKIVNYNVQQSIDQYGDAQKAEGWACVKTARSAINKALGLPTNLTDPSTQSKIEQSCNEHLKNQ